MADPDPFDATRFLGLSRDARRDPYRMALFAQHLDDGEVPRAFLAVQGGTLLVTDRRVLELRAHLEVHGAWNVKEFRGYEVRREVLRSGITDVIRRTQAAGPNVEDVLRLSTASGTEDIVLSRGPEVPLREDEFEVLRSAILADQPK